VFCWGLLLSTVLLLLVVVVLTAVQLTAVNNTVLVLSALAVCLIVVGALACFFLERLRRRALRRRDEGAKDWIHHTLSENEVTYWSWNLVRLHVSAPGLLSVCVAQQPKLGLGHLIVVVSRPHTVRRTYTVGLL
jgi:hypothetical protein